MRIKDKINEVEGYISELEDFMPSDIDVYLKDKKTKAACERYFEKIVEAITDLCFLIIKEKGFESPEEDKQAFDILSERKVLSKGLAEKLRDAKGMRNIIAHEYGTVDDEIVFHSITREIIGDVRQFLREIQSIK